jgi:hypothetical protein
MHIGIKMGSHQINIYGVVDAPKLLALDDL